jgi:hypothetical protein
MALMNEAIDGNMGIYNVAGEAHHPAVYAQNRSYKEWDNVTLPAELDAVLAGKGLYYEGNATAYFIKVKGNSYTPGDGNEMMKTWTRQDSAGPYEVYVAKEPDKPDYETGDSVYKQVLFIADSLFAVERLVLHLQPAENNRNRLSYSGNYRKESKLEEGYRYEFNKPTKLLRLYNRQKKLQRQYRVLMINSGMMVLELTQ